MAVNWQGVYPAVTTQYNDDLSINFEATQKMIDTIINEGVDGIIALGTVGENASHTRDEKIAILKAVKEVVAGRVPVLSGVAETSTKFAVEFSLHTMRASNKPCLESGMFVLTSLYFLPYFFIFSFWF